MIKIKVDDRITLKAIENQEAKELYQLIDKNREHLKNWIGWVNRIVREEDFVRIVESWNISSFRTNGVHLGIYYDGNIVGMLDYLYIDEENDKTEFGCWLDKGHTGQGIMTKATAALVDYSFKKLGLHRVEIHVSVENTKSKAVPKRLGFTNEGCLRDVEKINGKYHNHIVFSMLDKDWLKDD